MTWAEQIKALQDSYEEETGERPTRRAAEVLLDRLSEARYQIAESGGFELPEAEAAREFPPTTSQEEELGAIAREAEAEEGWEAEVALDRKVEEHEFENPGNSFGRCEKCDQQLIAHEPFVPETPTRSRSSAERWIDCE